jgi:hypothetical protein
MKPTRRPEQGRLLALERPLIIASEPGRPGLLWGCDLGIRSLKTGALTKAVENALSQRSVVSVEMMPAGGA